MKRDAPVQVWREAHKGLRPGERVSAHQHYYDYGDREDCSVEKLLSPRLSAQAHLLALGLLLHRAPRLQKLFSSPGHINSPTQTFNSSNLEKVVPRVGSIILCQIMKGTPCAGEYASLTRTQEH